MQYKLVLDRIYNKGDLKYSIVIPVYNQEKIIIKNISSLIENTLGNYEIILINDFSSDQTLYLLKNFFSKFKPSKVNFKRIRLLNTNWPLFETKCDNIGFKLSKGDYVLEIQADMEMTQKGYNETLAKPFKVIKNLIAVSGRGAHFFDDNKVEGVGKINENVIKTLDELRIDRDKFFIYETCMRGPLLIDNKKLKEMNYLDEKRFFLNNSDHDLMLRARLTRNYTCGYKPIEFNSPLEDGSTRKRRKIKNLKQIFNLIEYQRLKFKFKEKEKLEFKKFRKVFKKIHKEINLK